MRNQILHDISAYWVIINLAHPVVRIENIKNKADVFQKNYTKVISTPQGLHDKIA